VLRVSRTLADLDASDGVFTRHVAEAVQYRVLDRAPSARLEPELLAAVSGSR